VRAASFVAQQPSQGGHVVHDVVPIVQTTVGTRAQNAGNAGFRTACGPRRGQQIVFNRYLSVRKNNCKSGFHHTGTVCVVYARSIEPDVAHPKVFSKRRTQLLLQNLNDFGCGMKKRIEAGGFNHLCIGSRQPILRLSQHEPVAFGGATICNQING
jgi:hypothetical protein